MFGMKSEARQALLDRAGVLVNNNAATSDDIARAGKLMELADRMGATKTQSAEDREFEQWIRSGEKWPASRKHFCTPDAYLKGDRRDMGISTPVYGGWITPAPSV